MHRIITVVTFKQIHLLLYETSGTHRMHVIGQNKARARNRGTLQKKGEEMENLRKSECWRQI